MYGSTSFNREFIDSVNYSGLDKIVIVFIILSFSQSEEKIKAVPSLYGILMTLNHMVQQDYFPKSLAPVLSAFVTK